MIWVVAVCKDSRDRVIGYRMYDTDTKKYIDASEDSVKYALTSGTEVANIQIDDIGEIVGTRGNLKNYTTLKCGMLMGKSKFIVIEEIIDDASSVFNVIAVSSTEVREMRMSLSALISYNEHDNNSALANASIVTNANGTKFIRGIGGEIKKRQTKDVSTLSMMARNLADVAGMPWEVDEHNQFRIRDKKSFNASERNKLLRLPDNVCYVGDYGCSDTIIERLIAGSNLSVIGIKAFENCINLNQVTLNNGLKIIKDCAFRNCIRLKEIEIPASVVEIGPYAFGKLNRLILCNRRTVLRTNAVQRGTRILYK